MKKRNCVWVLLGLKVGLGRFHHVQVDLHLNGLNTPVGL